MENLSVSLYRPKSKTLALTWARHPQTSIRRCFFPIVSPSIRYRNINLTASVSCSDVRLPFVSTFRGCSTRYDELIQFTFRRVLMLYHETVTLLLVRNAWW